MPGIHIRDGDSFEAALKKFKKQCEKAGTLSEIRKREHYEKPSVKRKKKEAAAKKRLMKKITRIDIPGATGKPGAPAKEKKERPPREY